VSYILRASEREKNHSWVGMTVRARMSMDEWAGTMVGMTGFGTNVRARLGWHD